MPRPSSRNPNFPVTLPYSSVLVKSTAPFERPALLARWTTKIVVVHLRRNHCFGCQNAALPIL